MKINRISDVLKKRFGEKVYKLSLTSGCTCPNRDGTKSLLIAPLWSADKKHVLNTLNKMIDEADR